MTSSLRALVLLGLLVVPARASEPPRVAALEIRAADDLAALLDLSSLFAFAPGDRLDDRAVRRTLSNAYATGLVEEAELLARPTEKGEGMGDGITAVLVLRPHVRVVQVEIVGEPALKESLLREKIEQKPGLPISESALLRSVYALQNLYAGQGYFGASVRLEVRETEPHRVAVVFRVRAGTRAAITSVRLAGEVDPKLTDKLLGVLRLGEGELYDSVRLGEDLGRLRAKLVDLGYLQARVERPLQEIDESTSRVLLEYPVELGPRFTLDVEGAELEKLEKKGLLLFFDDISYDPALLSQSRERILEFFQAKGHYRAGVTARQERTEDGFALHLAVDPGEVYRLVAIRFVGNAHFAEDELRRLMTTSPRRSGPSGGRLVLATLRADLTNLRSFYALQGFFEVEIGPESVAVEGKELRLTIPIREGRRQRVVGLDLEGVSVLDPDRAREALSLRPGGPFHPILLDDSINVLGALYEDAGYPNVSVTPRLDWGAEGTLVDVVLEVREGVPWQVDRVVLRGYRRTDPEVLRRLVHLESGEPITRRRLLKVERDLYGVGIFSRVDVEPAPVTEILGRRDILVRLDEGSRYRLAYGFSYHSDDGIGGLLSLSRTNLRGRGDRLQLDLRGNERDRRFRLLYDQPLLGRFDLPVTYTLFRQDEERDAFTVDETGAQMTLSKRRGAFRLDLVYDYRLIELSEESIDPRVIDRQVRDLQISSLSPTLFFDRRDDPLDPQRGWSSLGQLEYAFPVLGADTELWKLFLQQTAYLPLRHLGVVAMSVRVGAIEPLSTPAPEDRDPLVPPEFSSSRVPASERFFAGGRTTHRAFGRDDLGIPGETLFDVNGQLIESGGNGLFLLNLDYRFPIAGAFGGTVFADIGNVWADWRDIDPGDLRPGMGIGFRYASPIGPLRLELGWNLDRQPGEESAVFFLSFGNPF